MKRRFAVTLLAVAIAAIGATASAMAPTIRDIPSPVIADDTPVTDSNLFVYPDALDADTLATDDVVTPGEIIWSYTGPAGAQGRYMINGVDALDPATEDPNNPGAKRLDTQANDPEDGATPRELTFRDITLSPIGGANTDPVTSGVVASEVVTLFASDGSSFSQGSVLVYTENNGVDRLSGAFNMEGVLSIDWINDPRTDWVTNILIGDMTHTLGASGLCIEVPAAGANFGEWISPYGIFDVTANQVYRIRATVDNTGAEIPIGQAPMFALVVDNFGPAQENKFGGEFLYYDNEGGANTPANDAVGINTFDFWWTPLPVLADDWNDPATGEFRPEKDPNNDVRMFYRFLDVPGAIAAEQDAGNLCMSNLSVDRISIQDMMANIDSTVSETTDITQSTHSVRSVFGTTDVTYAGGDVTIEPQNDDAWDIEKIEFDVGDQIVDFGNPASLADNWPIAWNSNELLMGQTVMTAPSAAGETNPPDAMRLGFDTPTVELLMTSTVAATTDALGMPKQGVDTTYTAFFYTHQATNTSLTNGDGIRHRVDLLCNQSIGLNGQQNNTGGVTIRSQAVYKVNVPQ